MSDVLRLTKLEDRVTHVEEDASIHRQDDQTQFIALRADNQRLNSAIEKIGVDLGKRIDRMGDDLQGQITTLTLDKAKAEGRAEGIASVTAAAARPSRWDSWIRWIVGGICAVVFGVIVGLVTTILHLYQDRINALEHQPAAQVTVNPAPAAQPAPTISQQMIPPTAPPAPADPASP